MSDIVLQSVPSVPVPLVLKVTVTSSDVALDKVAVKVKDVPAFSVIEVADVDSVTTGVLSFSAIVIVTDCDPLSEASAPETDEIEIIAVSLPSYTLSSVGSNATVPVVCPAETVILVKVPQSLPLVDVPAVLRLTITSSSAT